MDLLLENVHPQMTTWINPWRTQVEQFLGPGVASVTQRNWYKRCRDREYAHILRHNENTHPVRSYQIPE